MGQTLEHFVTDAGDAGQQDEPGQDAHQIMRAQIIARNDSDQDIDDGIEQNGQEKRDEKEGCAAAGVQTGKTLCVFGCERLGSLVAVDGFMFGTVILECAVHIGDLAGKIDITDEDQDADDAGKQVFEQKRTVSAFGNELDDEVLLGKLMMTVKE